MSNSTLIPQGPLQSQGEVLGPGIAGLFMHGLGTGLVIAQFSRWFSSPVRNDRMAFSALVVFVTVVGFAQSGLWFASTWRRYVQNFGKLILPDWMDYTLAIHNFTIAVPIQGLMIRLCFHIVGKNMYTITPLVLLLITSIATSIWSIVRIFQFEFTIAKQSYLHLPTAVGVSYLYLINLLVPSILDVALTGILLHRLTRTMKQVYAAHLRRRLSHLMTVVWQSAIPPTLCTISLCILYIRFAIARHKTVELWFTVIQGMIGKLYALSLFYIINDPFPTGEQPPATTFVPTLTIPVEGCDPFLLDTGVCGAVSCHPCTTASVSAISTNTAV